MARVILGFLSRAAGNSLLSLSEIGGEVRLEDSLIPGGGAK